MVEALGRDLADALAGKVSGAVETGEDAENRHIRTPGSSLIEIYSPLIGGNPKRVYAVAEFYQRAFGEELPESAANVVLS